MTLRLLPFAVVFSLLETACAPPPKVPCVVRVYRPDGVLHREYHGTSSGRLPLIYNCRGGAAYVVLNGQTIDAAAGWQIEVDRGAEVVE
jgi:hypothetical protein